ncbi:G5 domain-containing protein [Gemella cuniculi]
MKIVRVEKTTETKKESIEFTTKEEKDDTKYTDEKVTKVEGKTGEKEVTYDVVKENGKVISQTVNTEKVLTQPTTKVVSVGTKTRPTQASASSTATQSVTKTAGGSVVLANGNTAGSVGAAAAQEMARRTGVPASTWETIIARESNGQVNAYNPSGARGLFQTMPGWGSTATVQDQINAATRAYRAQGLSAWGVR